MGDGRKGEVLCFYVSPQLRARMLERATKEERAVSWLIRHAMTKANRAWVQNRARFSTALVLVPTEAPEQRTVRLGIRVTSAEKEAWSFVARQIGMPLSELVRRVWFFAFEGLVVS